MQLGQDEERIAVETMRAFDADDAGRVQQILEAQPALVADFVKGHQPRITLGRRGSGFVEFTMPSKTRFGRHNTLQSAEANRCVTKPETLRASRPG